MKPAETAQDVDTTVPTIKPKLAKTWVVRWLCIVLAWLCLGLGTLGIVIPGLPTFDFYFLATIFAAKGSARLHGWIVNNRFVAPVLNQWQNNRTLPLKVKIISLVSMSIAATIMILKVPHPIAVGILITCMACAQIWMWTRT
jgi:uncharacterized protein